MFVVCSDGNIACVQSQLDRGADVSAQHGMPLVKAALYGHKDVVELLLSAGADVSSQQGMALIRASSKGHDDIVDVLVGVVTSICSHVK